MLVGACPSDSKALVMAAIWCFPAFLIFRLVQLLGVKHVRGVSSWLSFDASIIIAILHYVHYVDGIAVLSQISHLPLECNAAPNCNPHGICFAPPLRRHATLGKPIDLECHRQRITGDACSARGTYGSCQKSKSKDEGMVEL